VVVALVVVLAGCGGATAPVTPAPVSDVVERTPEPPGPALPATPIGGFDSGRVSLGAIQWAVDLDPASGGPLASAPSIPDDAPRFWAAIPVLRAEPGLRLRADWSYNDTPMPALAAEAVVPTGDVGFVLFDLGLPPGERWPVGDYAVAISVDGVPALTASIAVVATDA
jgi:hypothetical protein